MASNDYLDGMTAALCWISDIFESRSNAFHSRGLLRKKDVKLIASICDAAIRSRFKMAEVGPRNMDLVLHKSGKVEFIERKEKNERSKSNP